MLPEDEVARSSGASLFASGLVGCTDGVAGTVTTERTGTLVVKDWLPVRPRAAGTTATRAATTRTINRFTSGPFGATNN